MCERFGERASVDRSVGLTVNAVIRRGTQADLAALATWSSAVEDVYRPALKAGDHVVLIAAANGQFPIGHMLVRIPGDPDAAGVLSHLMVLAGFRGQGLGTAFLEEGERLLREAGAVESQLSVEKRNTDAERLYKRLGYRVSGETIETWPEPMSDGTVRPVDHPSWVMRKKL